MASSAGEASKLNEMEELNEIMLNTMLNEMEELNEIKLDEEKQKAMAAEWKVILAKTDAFSVIRKQAARIVRLEYRLQRYQALLKKMFSGTQQVSASLTSLTLEANSKPAIQQQTPLKKWKMVDGRWVRT